MKKKYSRLYRHPSLPVFVMGGFTLLLFLAMVFRVYQGDRDLAIIRLSGIQALLASEGGVNYALIQVQKLLGMVEEENPLSQGLVDFNVQQTFPRRWTKIGAGNNALFKITDIRKVPAYDKTETPLFDESNLWGVTTEGQAGGRFSRTSGVVFVTDLVSQFAVVNSLDEFFYGKPIQAWASASSGLEAFREANEGLFAEGRLSPRGVSYDPALLVQMFRENGSDSFLVTPGVQRPVSNYGSTEYKRSGESPCEGPLYCQTPIIVDSFTFWGPVQTAGFLYRRDNAQPRIQMRQSTVALTSSRRIQRVLDKLEGDMPEGDFFDADSRTGPTYLPSWRPNFAHLRQAAKKSGIYIDADGKGWDRGQPFGGNYHSFKGEVVSESYQTPTSKVWQRDQLEENFVILSTKNRFANYNNLDAENLKGAKLLFSENSVFLRGQIGGDLVIVTPKHIILTGSTNDEGNFHLLLVPGEGTGISTIDLETFVKRERLEPKKLEMARNWLIRAVIYKPGAGWFCKWDQPTDSAGKYYPTEEFPGQKISVTIQGACIEGNVQRWLNHVGPRGLKIQWDKNGVERLPLVPRVANLLRMKSDLDRDD